MISKTELTFSAANYRRFGHNPITYISSLLHNCISAYCPRAATRSRYVDFYKCLFQNRRFQPAIAILDRYIRSSSIEKSAGCSNSRPNRIIFIVHSRNYNFGQRDFSRPEWIEKYVGTTCLRGEGVSFPASLGGEGFSKTRRKAYPSGAEILFRSLAINAKRLTGQSSREG